MDGEGRVSVGVENAVTSRHRSLEPGLDGGSRSGDTVWSKLLRLHAGAGARIASVATDANGLVRPSGEGARERRRPAALSLRHPLVPESLGLRLSAGET
jgi:hypothetical protein